MDDLDRLARAAQAGDERALADLVAAAYEPVWRLCAGMVDPASADDLAQDSLLRVVRALPAFRGDASARTWMLAIARNACLDDLRARVRRRALEGPAPAGHADHADPGGDPGGDVTVADLLRRLEPDRRAAFVLTQLLGLSYREAAEVCGCPTGTIRSRVARARADLLALLAQDEGVGGDPGTPEPRPASGASQAAGGADRRRPGLGQEGTRRGSCA